MDGPRARRHLPWARFGVKIFVCNTASHKHLIVVSKINGAYITLSQHTTRGRITLFEVSYRSACITCENFVLLGLSNDRFMSL